jgi:hypothetical protein
MRNALQKPCAASGIQNFRVAGAHGIVLGGSLYLGGEISHDPENGRYLLESNREEYEESLRWF